jgi:hypothetical protein
LSNLLGYCFRHETFCKNMCMVFLNSPYRKTPENVLNKGKKKKSVVGGWVWDLTNVRGDPSICFWRPLGIPERGARSGGWVMAIQCPPPPAPVLIKGPCRSTLSSGATLRAHSWGGLGTLVPGWLGYSHPVRPGPGHYGATPPPNYLGSRPQGTRGECPSRTAFIEGARL